MRLDKIDLNLFVVFDAIYREGSLTAVARLLHLTQPAISNALARLRQTFDDQLFVRTPKGMVPTPLADNVIGDVRRALDLLGKSVGASAKFDPGTSQKQFRMAMNDMMEYLIMPNLLHQVSLQAPGIVMANFYQSRQQAAHELKAGTLDFVIEAQPVNAQDFGHRSLLDLRYVVAMRQGHPLATGSLTLDDYVSAQHIHISSRKKGRGHADVAIHRLGHKRSITLRSRHYLAAAEIISQSNLLWTAPELLARRAGLHIEELPFEVEPLQLHLYWNKSPAADPANRWMRELVLAIGAALKQQD